VLDLELTPGRVLAGRVLRPEGTPAARAGVMLIAEEGRHGWVCSTRADGEGRFALAVPDRRPSRLEAYAGKAGRLTLALDGLDLGQSLDVGDLVLRAEGRVAGRVTCGSGLPVPGIRVSATTASPGGGIGYHGGWDVTGEDGRFLVAGLRGESCRLEVGRRALELASTPLDGPDLELALERRFLAVAVVDSDGTPLPGAEVEAVLARGEPSASPGDSADEDWTSAEADGPAALALLDVGDFTVATLTSAGTIAIFVGANDLRDQRMPHHVLGAEVTIRDGANVSK